MTEHAMRQGLDVEAQRMCCATITSTLDIEITLCANWFYTWEDSYVYKH